MAQPGFGKTQNPGPLKQQAFKERQKRDSLRLALALLVRFSVRGSTRIVVPIDMPDANHTNIHRNDSLPAAKIGGYSPREGPKNRSLN